MSGLVSGPSLTHNSSVWSHHHVTASPTSLLQSLIHFSCKASFIENGQQKYQWVSGLYNYAYLNLIIGVSSHERIRQTSFIQKILYCTVHIYRFISLCRHSDEANSVDLAWAIGFSCSETSQTAEGKTWLLKAIKHISIFSHHSIEPRVSLMASRQLDHRRSLESWETRSFIENKGWTLFLVNSRAKARLC